MKGIAFSAKRGGAGKTSLAHALALGAAWKQKPAYLLHTDDREPLKVNGRPYAYFDARDPKKLETMSEVALNNDGLFIVDSGGNRPKFDKWIANAMDLVIVPFKPDAEDVKTNLDHLAKLEELGHGNIQVILNAYPSNPFERDYIRKIWEPVPKELVITIVPEVKAIRVLRTDDAPSFQTPPTKVNNLARALYLKVAEELDKQSPANTSEKIAI